jgi:hypothetical protein
MSNRKFASIDWHNVVPFGMSCFTITMSQGRIFFNSRSEAFSTAVVFFISCKISLCKGSPGGGLWMNRIFYLCNVLYFACSTPSVVADLHQDREQARSLSSGVTTISRFVSTFHQQRPIGNISQAVCCNESSLCPSNHREGRPHHFALSSKSVVASSFSLAVL